MKIILVGFMGSGKTTIGKRLAKTLNIEFADMDLEIEQVERRSINDIFEKNGEEYFRSIESKVLKKLLSKDNIIISTGGGIIVKPENIEFLKEQNNVVFLDGSAKTILKHLSDEVDKRPLLKESSNLLEKIESILKERYEKYIQVSDITIDINDKNIDEVASQILVYIR